MSVVVYLHTVVAFNFFRKFYSKEEDGELEENCKDLATVSLFRHTLEHLHQTMSICHVVLFCCFAVVAHT